MKSSMNCNKIESILDEKILEISADIINKEIEMEIQEHENRMIDVPEEIQEKFLNMAKCLDADRKMEKKKQSRKSLGRIAAIFLICIVSVSAVTLSSSEAFRKKVFGIFSNEKAGSITLRNEDETALISQWEDYWYPTYLPEGFTLIGAEEESHFLLYTHSSSNIELRIFEEDSSTAISFDTDTFKRETIQVGIYEGYLFIDENIKSISAMWITEKKLIVINIDGSKDKALAMKIIDNMEYIGTK
ncbi:hypothetical protein M2140_000200 [Clostridiales Family XIII bacterium PM5-7]